MASLPNCPGCGNPLTKTLCQSALWQRSPYGDEFSDELHQCAKCGAWSLVTFVDRFSGSDEVKIEGPMTEKEAKEQKERLANRV